jgi:hypothetical protein
MRKIPRPILIGALALVILSSACRMVTGLFPSRTATLVPAAAVIGSATPAGTSDFPLVPVTGGDVVYMQCQFCAAGETHAVLILPDDASFDVDAPSPVTCLTADVVNSRRIVICRGPQSTSFNINVCSDPTNCLLFPVALQPCNLLQSGPTAAPVYLTPVKRPKSSEQNEPAATQQVAPPAPPVNLPDATQPPKPPKDNNGNGKDVVICHISPGNPSERTTMTVRQSAWASEHKKHGDSLGPCP